MNCFKNMSDTELEIMEVLWREGAMTLMELLAYFQQNRQRDWKKQTLATFLSRLTEKGLLCWEMTGRRTRRFKPALTPEEYEQSRARGILDQLYQGSLTNFVAALYGSGQMKEEDLQQLQDWLSRQ